MENEGSTIASVMDPDRIATKNGRIRGSTKACCVLLGAAEILPKMEDIGAPAAAMYSLS
jgi:hypothetical protein